MHIFQIQSVNSLSKSTYKKKCEQSSVLHTTNTLISYCGLCYRFTMKFFTLVTIKKLTHVSLILATNIVLLRL